MLNVKLSVALKNKLLIIYGQCCLFYTVLYARKRNTWRKKNGNKYEHTHTYMCYLNIEICN